jgi:hypothetical protein
VVGHLAARAIEQEQPRGVAGGGGVLRDGLGREVVVEIGDVQNSFFCGGGSGGTRPKCW